MRIILNPGLFYFIVFTLVLSMGNTESARGNRDVWIYNPRFGLTTRGASMKSGKCTRIVKGLFGLQRIVDWFGMTDMILSLINRTCITETYWLIMRFNLPTSILDDIVYVIAEDRNTRTLWGGSEKWLSLLPDTSRTDFFYNYSSRVGEIQFHTVKWIPSFRIRITICGWDFSVEA